MPELIFVSVREAFNRVGAVKKDGSPYQGVRRISVASTRRHFRFWENDVIKHSNDQMELYRPPVVEPDWRFEPAGRSFYHSLLEAMNTSEPIFVTINRRAGGLEGRPVTAKDAAPLLAQDGNPAPGRVKFVNPETGELRVVMDLRGLSGTFSDGEVYADQFMVAEALVAHAERSTVSYSRSQQVRRMVLARAKGDCELCGTRGFLTFAGLYLETHHVVPLSESGRDSTDNVVSLCPTCHKKAHFALDRAEIKHDLEQMLQHFRENSVPDI